MGLVRTHRRLVADPQKVLTGAGKLHREKRQWGYGGGDVVDSSIVDNGGGFGGGGIVDSSIVADGPGGDVVDSSIVDG